MEAIRRELLASAAPPPSPAQITPAPKVADQFGITRRTLSRWIIDPELDFPQAVEINKRLYFKQAEIDAWKLQRARRAPAREAA